MDVEIQNTASGYQLQTESLSAGMYILKTDNVVSMNVKR